MERKKSKNVQIRMVTAQKKKKGTTITRPSTFKEDRGRRRRRSDQPIDERLTKEREIKEELVRLTKVVRGKYKDLRRDTEDVERYLEASAKPLVSPLKKTVVEGIRESMPMPIVEIKREKIDSRKRKRKYKEEKEEEEDQDEGESDLNKTADVSVQTDVELTEQYLKRLTTPSYRSQLDTSYGLRVDGKGGLMIGDSPIVLTKSKVIVNEEKFNVTPGLLELLTMKAPNMELVTNEDYYAYKNILSLTNAHRQMYSAEKPINATKGVKYTKVISKLFPPAYGSRKTPTSPAGATEKTHLLSGSGMRGKNNYTTNVNAMVNRLRLLMLSKAAGHTAHSEEIGDIIELLHLHKIIV